MSPILGYALLAALAVSAYMALSTPPDWWSNIIGPSVTTYLPFVLGVILAYGAYSSAEWMPSFLTMANYSGPSSPQGLSRFVPGFLRR